jgi:hypothetical protein
MVRKTGFSFPLRYESYREAGMVIATCEYPHGSTAEVSKSKLSVDRIFLTLKESCHSMG